MKPRIRPARQGGALRYAQTALLIFLSLQGCSSDRERAAAPEDHTAVEWTELAWADYEQLNYTRALSRFDSAIAEDAAYGPAYTGRGWARLALGLSANDFMGAVSSFDDAAARQQVGSEVPAGRSAARLALGGAELANAILDAVNARNLAPQFVFAHRPSFDGKDLRLIEAFAKAGQADWAGALSVADQVEASGIQQGNPGTYVVGGAAYTTFEGAVLAHLNKLSTSHAG